MIPKDFNGLWPATTSTGKTALRQDADVPTLRRFSSMDPMAAEQLADWCRKEEVVDLGGYLGRKMVLKGLMLRVVAYSVKSPYDLREYVRRTQRLLALSAQADREGPAMPFPALDSSNPK